MSYHHERREEFLLTMQREGMSPQIARRILRHAQTYHRLAELACSSEAADRDQVPCPEIEGETPRLCRDYGPDAAGPGHGTVPRYAVQQARIARLVTALCAQASGRVHGDGGTRTIVPIFDGDPHGACLRLQLTIGQGLCVLCVPTRGR